jgi:hypothetical protein
MHRKDEGAPAMTATLPTPTVSKSPSRRALLAGALGGLGALAASAIGRASPVRGAGDDGSIVHIGDFYANALSQTTWSNQANDNIVLWVASNADSGHGNGTALVGFSASGTGVGGGSGVAPVTAGSYGVYGAAAGAGVGVKGQSDSGYAVIGYCSSGVGVAGTSGASQSGVQGSSNTGSGVYGTSTSGTGVFGAAAATGVFGQSSNGGAPGVSGRSLGNSTGVLGHSGTDIPPAAKAKTGVYGYAAQDNFSRGVTGESPAGIGLYGISSSGYGVYSAGRVYTTKYYEMGEISNPAAPISNRARLFVRDNGSAKTQLCVRFNTGAVHVIATQP